MRRVGAVLLAFGLFCGLAAPTVVQAQDDESSSGEGYADRLKKPEDVAKSAEIAAGHASVFVLDFKPGKLGRVQIKADTGDTEVYWYLTYTLTNTSARARPLFVDITAYSDRGRHRHKKGDDLTTYFTDLVGQPRGKLRGTAGYHDIYIPDVYQEVRKILGLRKGQQLLHQADLTMPKSGEKNAPPQVGSAEQGGEKADWDAKPGASARIALPSIGSDETLKCVAIFKAFDREMDVLGIFVRGLSNSAILADNYYSRPADRPGQRDLKEAVLVLTYQRKGDEFGHGGDPIKFVGRRWTDQPRTIKSDLASEAGDSPPDGN